jgi:hypothetical protein
MNIFDPELVAEFWRCPVGNHSPNLQALLNVMRGGPLAGKYVLICRKPHREWSLAMHSGVRGKPPVPVPGYLFTDSEDAERTVFRLRWKQLTGQELDRVPARSG